MTGPLVRLAVLGDPLAFTRSPDGAQVELVPGKRFAWRPFLEQAFALPRRGDWVRLRARCGDARHEGSPRSSAQASSARR